ncbi:MAG: G1 family glutamic endopeptidase [Solirubrobacteraceae bacterium]
MTTQETSGSKALRIYPPPPKDFDPFAATVEDLKKHGLPLRPDPQIQPGLAALWERQARRYRSFDHLKPQPSTATAVNRAVTPFILPLDPSETCGFSLFTTGATIGALFITWTVPDLQYSPSPIGAPNQFHTFVGLGFADLHVMMTVDSAENVTSFLWAEGVGDINLPVRPGDGMSASLCFAGNPQGTVAYFLANETTGQTMNFAVDTGFPPAVTVDAGVSRSGHSDQPPDFNPLARFGAVYFDDINIFTTSGPMSLTSGNAVTMVSENGSTLATPVTLADYAFKVVFAAG